MGTLYQDRDGVQIKNSLWVLGYIHLTEDAEGNVYVNIPGRNSIEESTLRLVLDREVKRRKEELRLIEKFLERK